MSRNIFFAIVLVGVLLQSCNDRPENVLSEKEMIDLLTDVEMAEAYFNTQNPANKTLTKEALIESVLKKHGISHAQLDSTIAYYGKNLDEYSQLYEKVENNLRAQNHGLQTTQNSDADDIWPYGKYTVILPGQMTDGITFSMPADAIKAGNAIEWKMRLTSPDGVEMMLGVEYEDGSSTFYKKNFAGNRSIGIELQTDTALSPKRIFGVMSAPQSSLPIWADSLRLEKTEFDSINYAKIRMQKIMRPPKPRPAKSTESSAKDSIKPIINPGLTPVGDPVKTPMAPPTFKR